VLRHRPGLSRGHPIKRLVRIIFSAPVADGIEQWSDPFYALRSSPPPTDTPDGSSESREQRESQSALLFPLIQVNHTGAGFCAKRCCYSHLCPDAAGITHQPADF
jgi:hypothetical protein